MYISIEVYKGDNDSFVAKCPELNLSSSGQTEQQAVDRLKEEIIYQLYVARKKHTDIEIGISRHFYKDGNPKIH